MLFPQVEGNYTLSVQTLSYVNLQSMCWSCDSPPMKATCCMNVGMECGQCDSQFQYCVGNGRSNCVTSSIDRTGNITFSTGQVLGLSNPLLFEGTSTTWMVCVCVYVYVYVYVCVCISGRSGGEEVGGGGGYLGSKEPPFRSLKNRKWVWFC